MLKKGVVGIVAAVLSIILLTGMAFSQDPYVVGLSMAVTGQGSETYAPIKDAFDTYFKEVNAKGGINGHPVKIIIEDNAAQPSKAATDAKKLVTQDKVILLMNASLSSTYAPMIQVANQHKVPLFFAGAVCPSDVYPPKADSLQFCSTAFAAKYDSRFALSFMSEQAKGPFKLGLVAMNIPVSRGEIDFAEELAKSMGVEVTDKEAIPPVTADFTPFATKIKNAGAAWVYAWAPWQNEVRTFEAMRKLGWNGKYLAYAHIQAEEELKRLKDDDFYVFGTNAFFTDNTETHKKIMAASAKEKTIYPSTQLTEGWIAAMVLEEILKKTPWPATPEKVLSAMNQVSVNMKGLKGGNLIWTNANHFRTVNYFRVYKWDSKSNGIVIVKDWAPLEVK